MRTPEIRPGIRRLFRLGARADTPAEADDEIRLHLHLRTAQLIEQGMSPDAARAEAERRFGQVDDERVRFRDAARRRESRLRLREWIDSVWQDVRYALRTLRRDVGFALFAVLIVGLGIGASATVFSLVNAVLLRPLPFRDASRLVWISNIGDDGVSEWRLQVDHVLDLPYGVSQRTQEIGIRMALGASAAHVRTTIVRGTLALAAAGIVIGAAASAVLVRSLRGMLFGVEWNDPLSFAGALILLVLVAAAAGHFPARRASRVDPSEALRDA